MENSKSTPYLIKTNVLVFLFWEQRIQPKDPTPIIPKVSFPSALFFFSFLAFPESAPQGFSCSWYQLTISCVSVQFWSLFLIQVVEFSPLFALCPQTISLFFPQNSSQQNYFEELFESTKSGKSKCKIVKY